MEELLNVKQVAVITKLSVSTIYHYVAGKKIPHIKINRALRFAPEDLQRWINGQVQQPSENKKRRDGKAGERQDQRERRERQETELFTGGNQ